MSALYHVEVSGAPKGEAFKKSGRWRWARPNGGVETYPRVCTMFSVRSHVARLFRVQVGQVRLVKVPWERK